MADDINTIQGKRWFRIDKAIGAIGYVGRTGSAVFFARVYKAADGSFNKPLDVIDSGRFQTAFAIYSREDMLTDTERAEVEGASPAISRHDEACEWCGSLPGEDHKPTCPEFEDDGIKQCGSCGVVYITNCGCDDTTGTAVR